MDSFIIPMLAVGGTLAFLENRAEKCCETKEINLNVFQLSVLVVTVIGGCIITVFLILSWKELCIRWLIDVIESLHAHEVETEATIQPEKYTKS